jgi:DNA-binding NtrC family response regulator
MATILLIDDDRAVREMLANLLSEEHECHTADRAEQAVELLEFQEYDLVITDISMPGLGGLEVLRRVKQRHAIPVIIISGRADEYQDAALNMGAFAVLAKPFPLTALEESVSRAVENRSRVICPTT